MDGDGYDAALCSGGDCNEEDPTINPGATEIWYDGIDQNCDGNDDDQDGDGVSVADDCDDTNAAISPDATEIWYDGIDENCDGNDDDQDGDGSALPEDCDDTDASRSPLTEEIWYDGIDQNCDGNDEDQDGDGVDASADCNDTDPDAWDDCSIGIKGSACGCATGGEGVGSALAALIAGSLLARRRRSAPDQR
jgi:uncharacterized protein (TIGR03382 family)